VAPGDDGPFDLLVSTGRGLEGRCISALKEVLNEFDPGLRAAPAPFHGLVKAWVAPPGREAVRQVARTLDERPWHNDLIKRVVPIDLVVETDPSTIVQAARDLRQEIQPGEDEKFRVRVRKRGAPVDRAGLIVDIADLFQNGVDLDDPDFEVRVEVIRKDTGISLIRRGEIFPDL
jgi:tRNA(Ser,Leu) C12 N-acetylase TAN1